MAVLIEKPQIDRRRLGSSRLAIRKSQTCAARTTA